ncbi:LamG-like jellyroll fold domain-containing protein [Saccharothrix xinjiangensis]|uniref:LamG-like jellyroll fold domain-containing protein n=1 Tax=Saccharothrix xinjiangensis TaxID=204798 RepID=UPI0031E163FB
MLALVVVFAPLPVLPSASWQPPRAEPAPVTGAAGSGEALAAARRQGTPVEVTGLTTSSRRVSAQPDGTLTAELTAVPVRAREHDRWVDVDPTLEVRGDAVVPAAVDLPVTFANGGGEPLLTLGEPGRSLGLTWPDELPAPELDGPTATYRDVRPGVDLVLRAEPDGVAQHLVVHRPEAAAHVAEVGFGLRADGITVTAGPGGALESRDAGGALVLATPPATMWDATGGRRAPVGVRVEADRLVLTPDAGLLREGAYPITIDPDWRTAERPDWTKVFRGKSGSTHWHGGNDVDTWAKVGDCTSWAGCNGIGLTRSYFQFDTSFLTGKAVLSANFNATIVYGPSCATANHQLFMANGPINPGTSWDNAPQGWHVQTKPAESNYTGCAGHKGIGFDVKSAVNTSGASTYFIKAEHEGDRFAWRKYDAAATKILINYNSRPNPPTDLGTEPRLTACKWCGGTPHVGTESIRLLGELADADNDQLTARWDVYADGVRQPHVQGPTLGSGNTFGTDVDLRHRHGQQLTWTLWGTDGMDGGEWRSGPTGFVVDRIGVDRAPNVTGGLYQDDNQWHGGVGVPGTFTFDAAGVADVDHYLHGWSDPPTTKVDADALGGGATVTTAPPGDGPRDLYVQSVDRAGHRSPTKKLRTYVRAGNGPLAQWSFEGDTRDTAFLGNRHGTVSGTTAYTPGAVGSALGLDGATTSVSAPQAVRADLGYTVSAWVRIEGGAAQTVLAQDGFGLSYRPEDGGRWVFTAGGDAVSSGGVARTGVWTQLTAVHDVPADQVRLYVDGELSGTTARTAPPPGGAGRFRIGGASGAFTRGAVDEVKAYDRVLADTEVRSAVTRDNVQVGYWKLDEADGSTAANAVAGGVMGVLQGGAEFDRAGAVNGSARFDAAEDVVSTGSPVVRTDQSFSISAWVRQDQAGDAVHQRGAVATGFALGSAAGRWRFALARADEAGAAEDVAHGGGPVDPGSWTHLTGVYDAPAQRIRLYVDGVLAAEAPHATGFDAIGPLRFGGGSWRGGVDEVRVHSRVVSEEEIRGIVGQDDVTAGEWRLDGDPQDSSTRGLHGTPHGGPDYTSGQSGLPDPADLALRLDGTARWLSAPNAVRVDRSFSVVLWARVEQVTGTPTVVSQDGAKTSAFRVRVRPDGRWGFAMSAADDGAGVAEAIGGSAQVGQWTHLVGVHDAEAGQLLLYVNGVLAGSAAHSQTWSATGSLLIGRSKAGDFVRGSVDDVSAYSRALFAGEVQTMAGRDLTLVHNLRLDESSGSNAADAVGTRAAALAGGATFAPGRVGNAVAFDGVDDSAATTGVDLRTDQAFTVSALVKLPSGHCEPAPRECRVDAVTADGAHTSKFRLGHVIDSDNNMFGAWTFEMPESDAPHAVVTKAAVSTLPSEVDTWVHLVGVYEPGARKLWLYVNGTRVGDGTLNTPWSATGGLVLGRGKAGGAATAYWPGSVDDVRLYTGQLDKDRISDLFRSYPAEAAAPTLPTADAGWWEFDEGSGAVAADGSGRGRTATLKGGAGWTGGRTGSGAWLNGSSAHAETAGPVLDTGRSFSAAAWVHLTNADHTYKAVLGQDANRLSAFTLQFDGTSKKWSLIAPTKDEDDPATNSVVILNSVDPAAVGEWTHLAVTYDAGAGQVRLYVNGMLSGAQVGVRVLPSSGPLTIGRSKWNGQATAFFPRGVDDVRLYSRALLDGEVRRVHDDVAPADFGHYRFDDGTARDRTWRGSHATTGGGATFAAGLDGTALHLDGTTGSATTTGSLPMRDSFTVSAWARLSRDDKAGALISQDGQRMSGFALRYRPGPRRWVFGSTAADSDGSPFVEVAAVATPKVGQWTHVTGVYDFPGRQLRIYVNGELSGTRDDVVLWRATGKLVIGRGKVDGGSYGFFPGALDDVRVAEGVVTDAALVERGGWGAPRPGQLGRFVDAAGERRTAPTDQVPAGYRFQAPLGLPATPGPHTATVYACRTGADAFTSTDASCEGATPTGLVYTRQPLNIPTAPLYRCVSGSDRFDSPDPACEGATPDGLLGYSVAYTSLTRYALDGVDHTSTSGEAPPSYRSEADQGLLGLAGQTGTRRLMTCRDGADHFVSTDPACEGKAVVGVAGDIWTTAPSGGVALYRCRTGGDSFTSIDAACEGTTVDGLLGYALAGRPAVTALFEEES